MVEGVGRTSGQMKGVELRRLSSLVPGVVNEDQRSKSFRVCEVEDSIDKSMSAMLIGTIINGRSR